MPTLAALQGGKMDFFLGFSRARGGPAHLYPSPSPSPTVRRAVSFIHNTHQFPTQIDLERQGCVEREEVGARLIDSMAGGGNREEELAPRSLRRSVRSLKAKEARAKERSEILKLKREAKALMKIKAAKRAAAAAAEVQSQAQAQTAGGKMTTKRAAAEEAQPTTGKSKRKKVIKTQVPRELIEYMMVKPHMPLDGFPEEKLATSSQKFREFYAQEKAISDKILEYERALIKQFLTRGYAEDYTEVEVTDNEDN